jgi:hypothetical protein
MAKIMERKLEIEYRKIKRPFPPTIARPRAGSARTPRASDWPALDAAGKPQASPSGWRLGMERLRGWGTLPGGLIQT